ncbi:MAG: CDGSH iron-sulfur domain-containing protein [Gemmatimonadetes bacterium]|nr:CDGSH iron-sulfur domain-containing protein [Gemmatimonadota bacterium]
MSDLQITIRENGSLRIDEAIPLVDHEGNVITTPEGKPYSLCRCGGSSNKPFCDGSHRTNGFDGTLAAQKDG